MLVTGKNGLSFYRIPSDHPGLEYFEQMLPRGVTVDLPDIEAARLLESGQVVPAGVELPRGGQIMGLPVNASNVEIAAWVTTATDAEYAEALVSYPTMTDTLTTARA